MKLTRIKATNFMRLKVVEFVFDPAKHKTTLRGPNAVGKSAFMSAVMCLLGGKKYYPGEPVLTGEKKATLEGDLVATAEDLANGIEWEGLAVKRTISPAGGGTFKVTPIDDKKDKLPKPQDMLDALIGPISYDPMVFDRDAKARPQLLADVTGVDLSAIEYRRKAAFDHRTGVNREVKSIKARLAAAEDEIPDGVPESRVDINDLLAEQRAATAYNAEIAEDERYREEVAGDIEEKRDRLDELQQEVNETEECIDRLTEEESGWEPLPEPKDVEAIAARASRIDADNQAYDTAARMRAEIARMSEELQEEQRASDAFTADINGCVQAKADAIAKADLGVEGLEWREDGVYYKGVPFDQGSSAERTKISCAIGMAQNATLKFLLIHDASLLDAESDAVIMAMAMEHDCHVIQEVVSKEGEGLEITEE